MEANPLNVFGFKAPIAALYPKISILETLPQRQKLDVRGLNISGVM